jgi:hypothetical protein
LVEDPDLVALHATAKNWLRPWERTGRAAGGISEEQVSEVFAFLQSKKVGSLRIHVRDGALQEPTVVKEWLKQKVRWRSYRAFCWIEAERSQSSW